MNDAAATGARTRVTKVIKAPRAAIYAAFLDAQMLARWLPPATMRGDVHLFEPRVGGTIRMSLIYDDPDRSLPGKSSHGTDTFCGRFTELVADRKIVWTVTFESADADFAGEMTVISTLADCPGGTEIAMTCENIPKGIGIEDNAMGCRSSLQNLAALVEMGVSDNRKDLP